MKKQAKKLVLTRETLRGLDARSMKEIAGADTVGCTTYNTGATDTLTCAFCGGPVLNPTINNSRYCPK